MNEPAVPAREPTVISTDNRPQALRNPPIPLLADSLNQMSFGERAALEGLLSQLKPRLSVEIGTYEGGSLRTIAAHSGHVHTFDLDDLVPNKHELGNVTFHHGDSKCLLPAVLERCAAAGTQVDFALVDGDHSAEGVLADLESLLASPACAHTVIVLHDTMNPGVRAGIEMAGVSEHPRVVYTELDFVAGYEFAGGDFDGQRWGGLGLVIAGDRATDGYGDEPVQTRYRPIFDLVHPHGEPSRPRPAPGEKPAASIVVPYYAGQNYLDVTLASVVPQAEAAGAEVLVVSDGADATAAALADRHRARFVALERHRGLNAARNAGIRAASSDLLVLIDQDIQAPPGWLQALLDGVRATPDREVFGGPIRARLEGGGPRACGREPPPITTLDRGPADCDVPLVWGANMAMRRSAFERIGLFDEDLHGRGNEDDWEHRYTASGGRIRYLATAGLDHRRTPEDSRLRVLARAAYGQGREVRRHDVRMGWPRPIRRELRVLIGCAWHLVRRRCAFGIVMGARSAGSLREALVERRS